MLLNLSFLFILTCAITVAASEIDSWSFCVFADFHGAETFSYIADPEKDDAAYQKHRDTLSYIHDTYGGEVILLPGDTNTGRWYQPSYIKRNYPGLSSSEVIYKASLLCYRSLRKLFKQAGYETVLMAVGDHEIGDNGWYAKTKHGRSLDDFRRGIIDGFNTNNSDGKFYYGGLLKGTYTEVPTTPWGTDHEKLSYAYQHKNTLFVTIDIYEQMSNTEDYVDRSNGRGGHGMVTGTIEGEHLAWFERVLRHARYYSPSIRHVIVQSHLPVKGPVRKVKSSTMNVDDGVNSLFWKIMAKYDVDLYLAGEVHSTTAMKDDNSNLVQIVSRGNSLNNFLKIEVEGDILRVRHYNEVGSAPSNNNKYEENGLLVIDKTAGTTNFKSSGALELLDPTRVLIRFDFEEKVPLASRQVIGLKQMNKKKKTGLIASSIPIRHIESTQSMPNLGKFGQPYDAQVANLLLSEKDAIVGKKSGFFNGDSSRLAIYAMGPHDHESKMSFAVWIKTMEKSEVILVHYGASWQSERSDRLKNIFTLTLDNGRPKVYARENTYVMTKDDNINLNDGQWHHIAVSMPYAHCNLSEVKFYIDGNNEEVVTPENDETLFFISYGHLSLGGLGYSVDTYEKRFPNWTDYRGMMDEFVVWGRPITNGDLSWSMQRNNAHAEDDSIDITSPVDDEEDDTKVISNYDDDDDIKVTTDKTEDDDETEIIASEDDDDDDVSNGPPLEASPASKTKFANAGSNGFSSTLFLMIIGSGIVLITINELYKRRRRRALERIHFVKMPASGHLDTIDVDVW